MSENSLFELYKRGKITEEELKRATGIDKIYRNYTIRNDKSNKKDEEETKDFSIDNTLERVLESEYEEFKKEMLKNQKRKYLKVLMKLFQRKKLKIL